MRAGGGFNHRESLSDAVLIKDNHLAHVDLREAIDRARARWPGRIVEVECDTLDQVAEARRGAAPTSSCSTTCRPSRSRRRSSSSTALIPLEVSGGVTLETIGAYAAVGPDFISVGAITHSAPALDLALDLD